MNSRFNTNDRRCIGDKINHCLEMCIKFEDEKNKDHSYSTDAFSLKEKLETRPFNDP
jgi:hypothetical protein